MTILDYILLAVLGLFVIRGLFRGFLLELFDLVSLVIGYFAARWLGPSLGWWMADAMNIDSIWTGWIATITVFVAVTIAVRITAHIIKKIVHATPLAMADRSFGALFGALKTVLLAMALFFLAFMSPWSTQAMEYALEGPVSRVLVNWTINIQEMIEKKRTPSTQLFANWLRSAGVDDEAVHIVSDQPDLLNEIIEYARDHELNVPVREILSGKGAIHAPDGFEIDEDTQEKIVDCLEDTGKSLEEKAEEFWQLVTTKFEDSI